MTTGRINQVNGGSNINNNADEGDDERKKPSILTQHGHRGQKISPMSAHYDFRERVASLFPPWPEGQCLAPSADGRGPSRARYTPHLVEKTPWSLK